MAQSVTAKGITAEGSTSNDTARTVSLTAGRSVLIYVLSDGGDPDTVEWGSNGSAYSAVKIASVTNSTSGLTASLWQIKYILSDLTQSMTATWSTTNSERLIEICEIDEGTVLDITAITNTQDAATAPNTGTAGTSLTDITAQICFFGSNGRSSDSLGTLGEGHTSLESKGTTAVGTHLHVTYELLTSTGNVRGSKTGATSRDWCNIIVALKKRQTFTFIETVQHHREKGADVDAVWTIMKDESDKKFLCDPYLDPATFDAMSNPEYKNYVRSCCTRYANRDLDDLSNVNESADRTTRMNGFTGDTITI